VKIVGAQALGVLTVGSRRTTGRPPPSTRRDDVSDLHDSPAGRARVKQWLKRQARVVGSITALDTDRPHVVLTFDDGPDPVVTPQLLEVLQRHGATATFFVLLQPARAYPELLRQVAEAGHEIALHGLDHRRLPQLPTREAVRWLRSSRDELTQLTGTPVRWFRPPHGAQSPATWAAARALSMDVVLWNGTTWDWNDVSQEQRVAKALESARPGSILLAHDGAHYDAQYNAQYDSVTEAPVADVDKTDLLERVLSSYAARGLACRSLRHALAAGGTPVRTASFSR
jgi:peptidoglycan/xylan/chitin deacetylase (PgdA/CDA1 family)